MNNQKLVTLVFDDVLTPYKKGEIASFKEEDARKLLTPNSQKNDFGPIYPKVKAHEFDPSSRSDLNLLLENRVLSRGAHNKLCDQVKRPDLKYTGGDEPTVVADWAEELGILEEEKPAVAKTPKPKARK